jgi:hypothetical protein
MAPTTLLSLPDELLLEIPLHMHNLEDFNNASSTCMRLNVLYDTSPKTILHLASRSAPTFFSPHPHFLVLAIARQIAGWAVAIDAERETRVKRLVEAFRGGMEGLLTFALRDDVEGVGLTMDAVRRMYEARFSLINPLSATIDAMIGNAWYAQPDFWNGGAEDAFTLQTDASIATFELLIYGELFGSTMDFYLQTGLNRKAGLDIDTRIEFIKYCIPDWTCASEFSRQDGFEVLAIGPYAKNIPDADPNRLEGDQVALAHLVGGAMFQGTLWKRVWRRVLIAAGAEKNEDGKWPMAWIETIQRTKFRKKGGAVNSNGEHVTEEDADVWNEETTTMAGDARDETVEEEEEARDEQPKEEQEHDQNWRFFLFWNALTQVGGLQSMEMVAQFKGREENRDAVLQPEWKAHILRLRDQALTLKDEDEPGFKTFGRRRKLKVSEAPDLGAELYWCCAGMWRGF